MLDQNSLEIAHLLERAQTERLLTYNRVNGETITLQIGRVLYAMRRQQATRFLQDVLRQRAGAVQEACP